MPKRQRSPPQQTTVASGALRNFVTYWENTVIPALQQLATPLNFHFGPGNAHDAGEVLRMVLKWDRNAITLDPTAITFRPLWCIVPDVAVNEIDARSTTEEVDAAIDKWYRNGRGLSDRSHQAKNNYLSQRIWNLIHSHPTIVSINRVDGQDRVRICYNKIQLQSTFDDLEKSFSLKKKGISTPGDIQERPVGLGRGTAGTRPTNWAVIAGERGGSYHAVMNESELLIDRPQLSPAAMYLDSALHLLHPYSPKDDEHRIGEDTIIQANVMLLWIWVNNLSIEDPLDCIKSLFILERWGLVPGLQALTPVDAEFYMWHFFQVIYYANLLRSRLEKAELIRPLEYNWRGKQNAVPLEKTLQKLFWGARRMEEAGLISWSLPPANHQALKSGKLMLIADVNIEKYYNLWVEQGLPSPEIVHGSSYTLTGPEVYLPRPIEDQHIYHRRLIICGLIMKMGEMGDPYEEDDSRDSLALTTEHQDDEFYPAAGEKDYGNPTLQAAINNMMIGGTPMFKATTYTNIYDTPWMTGATDNAASFRASTPADNLPMRTAHQAQRQAIAERAKRIDSAYVKDRRKQGDLPQEVDSPSELQVDLGKDASYKPKGKPKEPKTPPVTTTTEPKAPPAQAPPAPLPNIGQLFEEKKEEKKEEGKKKEG